MKIAKLSILLVLALFVCAACSDSENADTSPTVRFSSPQDGATVSSPVKVSMQAFNYKVEPAGDIVEGSGHFHIMVDVGCMEAGEVIPSTDGYNHFGKAQLETELELEPGEYTLCLQMADGAHVATELTDEITITVE